MPVPVEQPDPLGHLCVDDFLRTLVDARALKTAFELGLIDRLEGGAASVEQLEQSLGRDRRGLELLVDLLAANGVLAETDGRLTLSAPFCAALRYRDLLRTKLEFAGFVTPDFFDGFEALLFEPAAFQKSARLFKLFDYQRCLEADPENYEWTRRWMRVTTTLTRYEARACLQHHDFGGYRRMLDVGGNSGEFALQLCKAHPGLRATIMDLPLVCEIGQEHLLPAPERDRIGFIRGNALQDPLPGGFDLVTFKSMLHDWPENEVRQLLARASEALDPGGTLLIFERGAIRIGEVTPPFSMLPHLLFFRSYRSPELYRDVLDALGFEDVRVEEVLLEMPFLLVTARRPA